MKTVVLLPYRQDNGYRDTLWNYLETFYWGTLPYPIVIGEHTDGQFNRSAAINRAASLTDWDVAVIADADTWVPAPQLAVAVKTAADTDTLTAAFDSVVELSQPRTADLLEHPTYPLTADILASTYGIDRVRTRDIETQSSMLAISRTLWDRIGGFDEKFVGWGGEDNAFWKAAHILGGEPHRVHGPAFHLWHPPACTRDYRRTDPGYRANLIRWSHYNTAENENHIRWIQQQ